MSKEAFVLLCGSSQSERLTYRDAAKEAGFTPIFITEELTRSEAELNDLLEAVSGIIVQGGEDVNPAHYRQKRHPSTQGINSARDKQELYIAKYALQRGKPYFGICRGAQVGGIALAQENLSLSYLEENPLMIQDIPTEVGNLVNHLPTTNYDELPLLQNRHPVEIAPHTLAFSIWGNRVDLPTGNHQAIRKEMLTQIPAVTVSGITADKLTAIVEVSGQFYFLVQDHPETDPELARPVFTELFNAALHYESQKKEITIFDMSIQ